ncbi:MULTISPECIES: hypothetical protein [Fusobacterium]|uniref:hypothetical protein n=1 Tax=Fusobacterium TaxID=848 RepID=UPI00147712AE|nr:MULTISPECIES: hypothetical protein [Fusobacterium]NME35936.1 hypothetical protein [Fusobacterium sp. FSA-380-WT-3A]
MKTYILIAILILLAIYSFRGIYRNFTGKDGCSSCGHDKKNGGCSCGGNCNDSNCSCKHD